MLVEIAEVVRPGLEIHFVCRPGEIPDAELMPGVALVQQGFKKPVVASVIENATSNQRDVITLFKIEREGGWHRLSLLRPGGGLQIDVILCQFG